MKTDRRMIALTCAVALLFASCGDSGGDDDSSSTSTTAASSRVADTGSSGTEDGPGSDEGTPEVGGVDDFEPGPVSFRLVHLAESLGAVDVYAFTSQGLVETYLLEAGVEPGSVLEDLRPPADGALVVFPAGTTDLDTWTNDDLVADVGTAHTEEEGPRRILVLADDENSPGRSAIVYWEDAAPSRSDVSNALPSAVPGSGLVVMASAGAESVYAATPGAGACLTPEPPATSNLAIGGTSVLAFAVPGPQAEIALHSFDAQDFDCTGEPIHQFTVDVEPGERVLVLTYPGSDGSLDTIALPLGGA